MPTARSETDQEPVDLAVVGAGPAGLAAAVTAADAGCLVTVLDLGDRVGGQYYRHASERLHCADPGAFHHRWQAFVRLRDRFERHRAAERIAYLPGQAVWSVGGSGPFAVHALDGERDRAGRTVRARTLLVATGAHDRHVPFPGWTLPGVVAVGGAQALLKGSLATPGRRAVVAGTGPFLLSVADGLLAAGVDVAAVVEANAPWQYATRPFAVAGAVSKLPEALGYAVRLARHRVPYLTRHAVTAAHGPGSLRGVSVARVDEQWRPVPGTDRRLDCDTVAVGYGFTPQLDLLLPLGCDTAVAGDGSLVVVVDAAQRTSVAGVYAAGETTGVGGADLAVTEGTLAGEAVARGLRGRTRLRPADLRKLTARRARLRRFAETLHAVHPVRDGWMAWADDATLICRCEEVTCGQVRRAVTELGAVDTRGVKLLTRPGMGWCQGRICGPATASLTAALCGRALVQADLEGLACRVLAQPVPLAALAAMDVREDQGC